MGIDEYALKDMLKPMCVSEYIITKSLSEEQKNSYRMVRILKPGLRNQFTAANVRLRL